MIISVLCFTLVSQLYLNPACLAVRKTHQNSMPINLRKSVSFDAKNSYVRQSESILTRCSFCVQSASFILLANCFL